MAQRGRSFSVMMRILQSKWMVCLVGAVLYLGTTVLLWETPVLPQLEMEELHAQPTGRVPSWEFSNPEMDRLIMELRKQKEDFAQREKDLKELEMRVQTEQQELQMATQAVYRLRAELDETVLQVRQEEAANLKKLAKTYAAMEPDSATAILSELEDSAIARILVFMKEDEMAPILATLARQDGSDLKRVASITERLRTAVLKKPADGASL